MKRAFITGVNGQDGAYLSNFLLQKGYEVHGGIHGSLDNTGDRLKKLKIYDDVILHQLDITDEVSVSRVLSGLKVDEFYNLAAKSFVATSWELSITSANVNGVAVVRLLDALRRYTPETRFYQASTSEMFGLAQEVPQRETTRFHPRSPYAAAKVYGHHMTVNYRESYGMHTSCGILFNHESPLRGREFVTRKITSNLARIARGDTLPLELGNLDAQRDWGFAGDYVEGMWLMLQQGRPDDYVLATGKTHSIREFVDFAAIALDIRLEWSGTGAGESGIDSRSGRKIVAVNPIFYRPAEVDLTVGDASKARRDLGWVPQMPVCDIAHMMARADFDELS